MRIVTIIISLIVLSIPSNGQDTTQFLFNELCLSVNRTTTANYNTEDRFGFGLGAYHTFLADKKVNLILGVEYNRTIQFKSEMYLSHVQDLTDVTFTIHNISLPLLLRVNFGEKKKLFLEAGIHLDYNFLAKFQGSEFNGSSNPSYPSTSQSFEGNPDLSLIDYGLSSGLGLKLPVRGYDVLIKLDYKFGMNVLYNTYYFDKITNSYIRILIGINIL